MGYAQVYTENGTPTIWGNIQISNEFSDNRQELMVGMHYWAKTNGIDIDTAELFAKLDIEEMVKTKFNPWGPVAMYEITEISILPLLVIPKTTQDIEDENRQEEASA